MNNQPRSVDGTRSKKSDKKADQSQYKLLKEKRLAAKQQLEQKKLEYRHQERIMRDKTAKELQAKREVVRAEKAKKQETEKAKREAVRAEKAKKQETEKAKRADERKHKKELDKEYNDTLFMLGGLGAFAQDYFIQLTGTGGLDNISKKKIAAAHKYDELAKKIGRRPVFSELEQQYAERMQGIAVEKKKQQYEEKIAKLRDQGYDENMHPLRPEDCITNPLDVENLNKPDMSLGEVMTDPQKDQVFITAKPKRLIKIEKFLARVKKQEDIISKWNQDHPDDHIEYNHVSIEKAKVYWKQIRNLLSVSTKERNREMDRWNSGTIPFADIPQFTYVKGYSPMPQLIDLYSGNVDAAKARFQKEMSRKYANGSGLPKEPLDGTPEIENHWQVASNIGVVTIRGGRNSVRDALTREYTNPRDLGIDPSEISNDQEKVIKSAGESTLNKGDD